jgi:hypothetical protein
MQKNTENFHCRKIPLMQKNAEKFKKCRTIPLMQKNAEKLNYLKKKSIMSAS